MTDAPAETAPSLDAIDDLLRELAADGAVLSWGQDRPLLPREARAVMERHRVDPATVVIGRSRETLLAAEDQLRLQADAFQACASALRAGDAAIVPPGNAAGSGQDEARELLTDASELRGLLHGDPEAVDALDTEHRTLADSFDAAAGACLVCALDLHAERHRLHHRDYERVLDDALPPEESEMRRRQKNAAKSQEGASA